MNELEVSRVDKIVELYTEFEENRNKGVKLVYEMGKLLSEQKQEMNYGEFGDWVERFLEPYELTKRTAYRYIEVYEYMGENQLSCDSTVTTSKIYKMIEGGKKAEKEDKIENEIDKTIRKSLSANYRSNVSEEEVNKMVEEVVQKRKEEEMTIRVSYTINVAISIMISDLANKLRLEPSEVIERAVITLCEKVK